MSKLNIEQIKIYTGGLYLIQPVDRPNLRTAIVNWIMWESLLFPRNNWRF